MGDLLLILLQNFSSSAEAVILPLPDEEDEGDKDLPDEAFVEREDEEDGEVSGMKACLLSRTELERCLCRNFGGDPSRSGSACLESDDGKGDEHSLLPQGKNVVVHPSSVALSEVRDSCPEVFLSDEESQDLTNCSIVNEEMVVQEEEEEEDLPSCHELLAEYASFLSSVKFWVHGVGVAAVGAFGLAGNALTFFALGPPGRGGGGGGGNGGGGGGGGGASDSTRNFNR